MPVWPEDERVGYPVAVEWREGEELVVSSPQELTRLLDRITAETEPSHPALVMVSNDGGSLAIGVGAPMSTLSHTPPTGDPPYMASVGDDFGESGEIDFWFLGHHSPCRARHAIANDLARAALLKFTETGRLPDEIAWEPV